IQQSLSQLTGEEITVFASGRTDAGVHALGQVIHFCTSNGMPLHRWCLALNHLLPSDIIALVAYDVPDSFHARHHAVSKIYRYKVDNARFRDVFHLNQAYHYVWPIDDEKMRKAAELLIGEHDFTSFCSTKSVVKSRIRTLYDIKIERNGQFVEFTYFGNGFLYNMVRILTGTLLEVGRGRILANSMKEILEAKERTKAGPTVPPEGLTLLEVNYETNLSSYLM
ncbi:MAG: tRNA pseudouridine(38-40) synthase TruA, partial [Bacilli bacterium]